MQYPGMSAQFRRSERIRLMHRILDCLNDESPEGARLGYLSTADITIYLNENFRRVAHGLRELKRRGYVAGDRDGAITIWHRLALPIHGINFTHVIWDSV